MKDTARKIIIVLSIILMFTAKYMPSVLGLNPVGMATMGIFIGTILLLIFANLTWPVFLCMFAFAFNGVYTLNECIKTCMGNSIFWFMMVNGIVIGAIERTGLFKRIALWIACRPAAKKNPWMFLSLFILSCLICGSLMNTTAVYLLFLALGTEILAQLGVKKEAAFGGFFMMAIMVAANISHAITPFGHSITILSINYFTDYNGFNFLEYCIFGYLCAIVGLFGMIFIQRKIFKTDISPLTTMDIDSLTKDLGPVTLQEKIGGILMAGIILWWISPTILQKAAPDAYAFVNSQLGIVAPLIVALVILCLVKFDGKPMLDITYGIKNAPWLAGITVAVSLFLGSALQNEEAGIIDAVSGAIAPAVSSLPTIVFVMIITAVIMLMSNFTSCTLSLMVGGIVTLTLLQGGVLTSIHGGALSVAMSFAAQAAFMTAPASAPAAIFAGSGWMKSEDQLKYGFVYAIMWWIVGILAYCLCSAIF